MSDHKCSYRHCAGMLRDRRKYCGDECKRLEGKERQFDKPTPPGPTIEPERVLQKAAELLLRDLVRAGRIVAWYHAPALLGSVPHSQQIGFPDLTIKLRSGQRPVQIELKKIGASLALEQLKWIDNGEGSATCWTLDEVREVLRGWGVKC